MVNNISWSSYWTFIVVLLVIYYGFVLLRYYASDLSRFLSPGRKDLNKPFSSTVAAVTGDSQLVNPAAAKQTVIPSIPASDKILLVKELLDEFLAFLEQAGEVQMQKTEILYGLNRIVKKYPFLPDSSDKFTINGIVINEAKEKCSVHVSEEEMVQVWLDT